ncbi:MAG: magnesium chelatase domain-containing protein, partial [Jatrophihabitantaceae bacterium]
MALAKTLAVALSGVAGQLVEIEADVTGGSIPGLSFTGLADTSVVESRDRIRAAMTNSGVSWPNRKITLALLPADVRKVGSRFDLAMAVALLAAAGEVSAD